jgi:hypothetical protein
VWGGSGSGVGVAGVVGVFSVVGVGVVVNLRGADNGR